VAEHCRVGGLAKDAGRGSVQSRRTVSGSAADASEGLLLAVVGLEQGQGGGTDVAPAFVDQSAEEALLATLN